MDPRRRRACEGDAFKGTIAHGYLTLSLGPYLNNQVFNLEGFAFALNYGLNKVRFPAPVPIPSKLRVAPKVKEVTDIQGGAQVVFEVSFEREGTEKPVCVAETVVRVYEGGAASSNAGAASSSGVMEHQRRPRRQWPLSRGRPRRRPAAPTDAVIAGERWPWCRRRAARPRARGTEPLEPA